MKKMRNLIFVLVLGVLLLPSFVKAETFTVCRGESNCNYDDLNELLSDVESSQSGQAVIDIRDSSEYRIGNHNLRDTELIIMSTNGSNINISGVSDSVILTTPYLVVVDTGHDNLVKLTNINFYGTNDELCSSDRHGMCALVNIYINSIVEDVSISNAAVGLQVERGYVHNIDKYTFNGSRYGIVVNGESSNEFVNRGINITNSKMGNCSCSLVVYDFGQDLLAGPRKRVDGVSEYSIKVDSSEINCAKYGADNTSVAKNPVIYLTSGNVWKKTIVKGVEFGSSANVVEGFSSKILIDLETDKTIKLSTRDNLKEYFDELKTINPSEIQWRVEDPSILKIEDGKVIPLKVGNTTIYATYQNTTYTINFRVTNLKGEITDSPTTTNIASTTKTASVAANPKTGLHGFLVIAVVVAMCSLIYPAAIAQKSEE